MAKRTVDPKTKEPMKLLCFDSRHDNPCPLPCEACDEECDSTKRAWITDYSDHSSREKNNADISRVSKQ